MELKSKRECDSVERYVKLHMAFMLFVFESIFVSVHVDCVCACLYTNVLVQKSVSRILCTHRFGLMAFIDFLSLYNELQGLQSVKEKGGRDVCKKQ